MAWSQKGGILQRLRLCIDRANSEAVAASGAGSAAHRVSRWSEYQARGGQWSFERWSSTMATSKNLAGSTRFGNISALASDQHGAGS